MAHPEIINLASPANSELVQVLEQALQLARTGRLASVGVISVTSMGQIGCAAAAQRHLHWLRHAEGQSDERFHGRRSSSDGNGVIAQ
jgi:hypothetical protein